MNFKEIYLLIPPFANPFKSPLLLAIRLFWGVSFLVTGLGKFGHLANVADFFLSLGIRLPYFSATLTALIEVVCGACLALGLASRLITIPLILTMVTAILTSEQTALMNLLIDPHALTHTDPFSFLFASLMIFVFGPGSVSVDRLFCNGNE